MKVFLKKIIPHFILDIYFDYKRKQINDELISDWIKRGKPVPPPHPVKQMRLKEYAGKFGAKVLVETGTFRGEMVEAQRKNFERIYSIELSHELFTIAASKFSRYNHIKILEGDSSKMLKEIVPKLGQKAVFWLDGHYSGGVTAKGSLNCPIFAEVDTIFSDPSDHILVIDDAKDFKGADDYPTISELESYILSKRTNYIMDLRDNIITFFPG
jgi:hypothetical protein